MIFPSTEFADAIAALCHGSISDEVLQDVHELLSTDAAARDEYLWQVELHGELAAGTWSSGPATEPVGTDTVREAKPRRRISLLLLAALLTLAALWLGQTLLDTVTSRQPVAEVVDTTNARWMASSTRIEQGEELRSLQRLKLSDGEATLAFRGGAILQLIGPAILEVRSDNSAYLFQGRAALLARSPKSQGFRLLTPTSTFVDISTAFTASVAPDGLSRLEVVEGEVDVVLAPDKTAPSRMRTGETLFIEPGEPSVMTRIEPGEGTAAFRFPSIAPPSRDDWADHQFGRASIRVAQGRLRVRESGADSGPATVLLDGVGQSIQDAPGESAFFEGPESGSYLIDLGQAISLTRVNTYSWHQHPRIEAHRNRAQQRYTLYGFDGDEPPDLSLPPGEGPWTRIARVNSDAFFQVAEDLDRPPQQACSIAAAQGSMGRFRYLLLAAHPSTFFGEIDIYGTP